MRILITGVCGFVGSTLALCLREVWPEAEIFGLDNFIRSGSERNRLPLAEEGIAVRHADLRSASDIDALPSADWVIDAAANPSVLAGVDGRTGSRQTVEHNLLGTVNMLEYCKRHRAGFVLLSTSRVYSARVLAGLQVVEQENACLPDLGGQIPPGLSVRGISEDFSCAPPLSIYGSTKLASEILALEYGAAFDFPVWINRCGVLAGAGQFGRADQGIFSFWINSWLRRRPLKYIGYAGRGLQVRDCLHPRDLVPLIQKQMAANSALHRIFNVSGGTGNSISLANLSAWCAERFGPMEVTTDSTSRLFDVPWLILDSQRAMEEWQWQVGTPLANILDEIARHAEVNPDWLEISNA